MINNVKSGAVIIALLSSLPVISHAKTLTCPFSDRFTVSAPAQTKVLSATTQGNIHYTQKSDIYFALSCADDSSRSSGDLLIKIGTDSNNQCSLTIHDGPFEMNPSVTNVWCNGKMDYFGVDHQRGTYDYTLKFIS